MSKKNLTLLLTLVIIGGLGFGWWFFKVRGGKISRDKYQAVFLSNGQVYFGKLKNLESSYPVLHDVYYLIVRRPLQESAKPEAEGEVATESAQPQVPQYTLIKLGNELHGPVDKMVINKKHILFVEDLKDEGKVVQAIKQSTSQQSQ